MKQFIMQVDLCTFENFDSFVKKENISDNDFIFTTQPIQDNFIAKYNFPCKFAIIENFGKGEPTTEMMDNVRKEMPKDTKRIIAIGGGSVIDIAKTLTLDIEGTVEDLYLGNADYTKTRLLTAVPTTCGTGSEVTNAAACELKSLKTKRGLSLNEFYPNKSVLITELLLGLPYNVFATSSIDALVHAIESFLSPKASDISEIFSVKAIRTILNGYIKIAETSKDSWTKNASEYLLASTYAGLAFTNAGCAAVHALSYPLGGKYHIAHGEANQLMLPEVMRKYKKKQPVGRINDLEILLSNILNISPDKAIESMISLVDQILERKPLREYGITQDEFRGFAIGVLDGQQRLLVNNYIELSEDDIVSIYEASY